LSSNDNHRSWAKHYDEVNRKCFGRFYDELTQQTLDQVNALGSNLRIVDFGAGTGRLSIPLAQAGHSITAVEPSAAMLAQLAAKDTTNLISKHHASLQTYDGPGGHDLAIAAFTVIAYIRTPEELAAAFTRASRSLKPEGHLLIDVPRRALFNNNCVDREGLKRDITFTETNPNHFTYHERTTLDTATGKVSYEDSFPLRYWTPEEVLTALQKAGLQRTQDWSGRFPMAGAEYWLCSHKKSWTRHLLNYIST
jgi:SAM-dependent methyltransferase